MYEVHKRVTVYEGAAPKYSTWIRSYSKNQIYMQSGQVFSKITGKQLPYKQHPGVYFLSHSTALTNAS